MLTRASMQLFNQHLFICFVKDWWEHWNRYFCFKWIRVLSIIADYSLGNFFFCWLLPVTWCMQASVSISSIIYSPVTISWMYTLNFKGFVAKTAFDSFFFLYFCNLWNLFLAENLSVQVYSSLCVYFSNYKMFRKPVLLSILLTFSVHKKHMGGGGGSTELN